MQIFISKDDKHLVYQDFKILLEEIFTSFLIIKNYEELLKYNLQFFPPEAVVIYYDDSMINNNKFHNLVYNSKYCILITTLDEDTLQYTLNKHYDITTTPHNNNNLKPVMEEKIFKLSFNKEFITWFIGKIFNYLRTKYKLPIKLSDIDKKIIIPTVISKKISPLQFTKNLFFLENVLETVNYMESIKNKEKILKIKEYNNSFLYFYNYMMKIYNQPYNYQSPQVLNNIILFNNIY